MSLKMDISHFTRVIEHFKMVYMYRYTNIIYINSLLNNKPRESSLN